jgi:hypothetical protein
MEKQLFDNNYENKMSLKKIKQTEQFYKKQMFGTLGVVAKNDRTGEITHIEQPSLNKIMVWAKHSMIKLMSGDIMCSYGSNRSNFLGDIYTGKGTIISNRQFLDTDLDSYLNTNYNITMSNFEDSELMNYPYFPTKMLFGTGKSSNNIGFPAVNSSVLEKEDDIINENELLDNTIEGWVQSVNQDTLVKFPDNYNLGSGVSKYWNSFTQTNYKNNIYGDIDDIWLPSFIYMTRNRPFEKMSEILVDKFESEFPEYNKITFSVTMPSQLNNKWYPYNIEKSGEGVMIKYAALFCDAAYLKYSGGTELLDLNDVTCKILQYGMPWAKRSIIPFTKTNEISVLFQWTIYFPKEI